MNIEQREKREEQNRLKKEAKEEVQRNKEIARKKRQELRKLKILNTKITKPKKRKESPLTGPGAKKPKF